MSDDASGYRPGRIIAGRYRIVSPLSQGGMGAVYLAQQVSLARDVALKVILERGSDPELVKRFDVEARAVCQLKHPNIITYHDYGRDEDGQPFLVMEYLAGYPGTKLVYGERRPGLLDLVHVLAQVCSALHEAHAKGIIHRDLKWSNVMICPQSHDPYFTKLIDFGIMKVATDGSSGDQRALTRTGMLLGTPEYMSPEAICGMPIDGRADEYSLAIMLWEALEGHRPFDAASHFELLRQQVQEPPPPFVAAADLMNTYPLVAEVVLRALEKHPDDRFDNIMKFQQALLQAAGLAPSNATSPARPAARMTPKGPAGTPVFGVRSGLPNGMPSSRTRLPAAPLTGPRPVDTRVKTGQQEGEEEPRRIHWAWLAAGFLVFLGIGFGTVFAITGNGGSGGPAMTAATSVASAPEPDVRSVRQAPDVRSVRQEPDARVAAEVVKAVIAAAPETTVDTAPVETAQAVNVATAPEVQVAAETAVSVAPETQLAAEVQVAADSGPSEVVAAAPEKPVAPTAPGQLYVQVDPWGNLAIDGRAVGRAPYDGEVKPGTHTVTVTNTYFKGAYSFRIKVESGRRAARTIVLEDYLQRVE